MALDPSLHAADAASLSLSSSHIGDGAWEIRGQPCRDTSAQDGNKIKDGGGDVGDVGDDVAVRGAGGRQHGERGRGGG